MPRFHAPRFESALLRHGKPVRWLKAIPAADYNPSADAYFYDQNSNLVQEHGHVHINQSFDAPAAGPALELAGQGSGALSAGAYRYAWTICTDYAETTPSPVESITVSDPAEDGKVEVKLPAIPGVAVVARRLYRTRAGKQSLFLVAEIAGNGEETYLDNTADGELGAEPPDVNLTFPLVHITEFKTTLWLGERIGRIKVANANIVTMPTYCLLSDMDKLYMLHLRDTTKDVVQRGIDILPRGPVASIRRILSGQSRLYRAGIDYELESAGSEKGRVKWLDGGESPNYGDQYSVEYETFPSYYFMGDENRPAREDEGGDLMPQRGRIVMRNPADFGNEEEAEET